MKVHYIYHSGFAVELNESVLIFDYYKGELPDWDPDKNIYVFSSHMHADHFQMSIFRLSDRYPHIHYFLSRDIKRKYGRNFMLSHGVPETVIDDQISFTGARSVCEDVEGIRVSTLKSTDAGVAFLVDIEGKTIYHAGDLNWWTWPENAPASNEAMIRAYCREIDILKGRHIDTAFVVADGRQEDYWQGFHYFASNIDADELWPIHLWDNESIFDKLINSDLSADYRQKIRKYKLKYNLSSEKSADQ